MRGRITTAQVLEQVQVQLDRRAGEDFLARRLLADCRAMPLADELTRTLYLLRPRAEVVIATDNADCFVEAAKDRRDLRFADGLLSSSDLGVLKAEDPARFFGPWLATRGLGFESAVLVGSVLGVALDALWTHRSLRDLPPAGAPAALLRDRAQLEP